MRIVGKYSFNGGKEVMEADYSAELEEIVGALTPVEADRYRTKESHEKTMLGKMLYSPGELNKAIKHEFIKYDWNSLRVACNYPTEYYVEGYTRRESTRAFRDMDFVKNKVGVEVQFGKYSFMVYNVAAKMTIFHNLGHIDVGVEIVPVKELADDMSSGVSYFEQFIWDLEQRSTSDIDIPVYILGITRDESTVSAVDVEADEGKVEVIKAALSDD